MTRTCWLVLAFALMPFAATEIVAASAAGEKPNIIFILADDLGYGELGCYGQKSISTPYLDKMAQEGMRFTDCYAGSTVCAPSRCCLMTGLHTGHAYVRGNLELSIRPQEQTVAKLLKQAGYTTAIIGKWGLGDVGSPGVPNQQGFDYFFGYLHHVHAHNHYPDFLWRNGEKVRLRNEVTPVGKSLGGVATKRVEYADDLFAEDAMKFVERGRERPFFLYLCFTTPHANNEAGNEGMEVPDYGPYADKNWPAPEKGHAAMVTRMDAHIGRLLAKLKQLGIDDKTVVFFTSDNGPHKEGGADPSFFHCSGPFQGYKRSLHEGGIRVPMIVRWPGKIKAGAVSNLPWAFWDFMPTAADLAGISAPADIDGISVVPTLLGREAQREHEFLYWEFHEGGSQQAVRMGKWKGIRKSLSVPLELYDLQADQAEAHDVASQHPDVAAKIENYLKTAHTESEQWPMRERSLKPKKAGQPRS